MIASRPPGYNSGLVLEDGGHFHVTARGAGVVELEIGYTGAVEALVTLQPHERRLLRQLLADSDQELDGAVLLEGTRR